MEEQKTWRNARTPFDKLTPYQKQRRPLVDKFMETVEAYLVAKIGEKQAAGFMLERYSDLMTIFTNGMLPATSNAKGGGGGVGTIGKAENVAKKLITKNKGFLQAVKQYGKGR